MCDGNHTQKRQQRRSVWIGPRVNISLTRSQRKYLWRGNWSFQKAFRQSLRTVQDSERIARDALINRDEWLSERLWNCRDPNVCLNGNGYSAADFWWVSGESVLARQVTGSYIYSTPRGIHKIPAGETTTRINYPPRENKFRTGLKLLAKCW